MALSLDDDQVSRNHARLSPSGQGVIVEDLGTTNGTYVNDQPIVGPRELVPGDRVRMGITVLELRTTEQVAQRPTVMRPVPQVTRLDNQVLAPVPEEQLPASRPVAPGVPSVLTEETEPAFVPREVINDDQARSDYQAIAALVDRRVKRQSTIAVFALLAVGALALIIFFGLR